MKTAAPGCKHLHFLANSLLVLGGCEGVGQGVTGQGKRQTLGVQPQTLHSSPTLCLSGHLEVKVSKATRTIHAKAGWMAP